MHRIPTDPLANEPMTAPSGVFLTIAPIRPMPSAAMAMMAIQVELRPIRLAPYANAPTTRMTPIVWDKEVSHTAGHAARMPLSNAEGTRPGRRSR